MDRRIGDFYPATKRVNLKDRPEYLSGRPVWGLPSQGRYSFLTNVAFHHEVLFLLTLLWSQKCVCEMTSSFYWKLSAVKEASWDVTSECSVCKVFITNTVQLLCCHLACVHNPQESRPSDMSLCLQYISRAQLALSTLNGLLRPWDHWHPLSPSSNEGVVCLEMSWHEVLLLFCSHSSGNIWTISASQIFS